MSSQIKPRPTPSAEDRPESDRQDPQSMLEVVDMFKDDWLDTPRGRIVSVKRKPLFNKTSKIFTMGSCFALEIRAALRHLGLDVYPKYYDIEFDPDIHTINGLPHRDNINHYTTHSIRQEFERALAPNKRRDKRSPWPKQYLLPTIRDRLLRRPIAKIDKYFELERRGISAPTIDELSRLSARVDQTIADGIFAADVFIITLGLIEAGRDPHSRRFLSDPPKPGTPASRYAPQNHFIDFDENLKNMRRVVNLISSKLDGKTIVLTVSPVALRRTFRTDVDVVTANCESKSTLRAVAGQIAREYENVHYFPSLETSWNHDIYAEDGRHVRQDAVNDIVSTFVTSHCEDDMTDALARYAGTGRACS